MRCTICAWTGQPCSDECLKEQLSDAYKHCNDNFTAQLITGNRTQEDNTERN